MRIIRRKISVKKMINIVLIVGMFVVMFSQTAFAATDMWSKAEEIMKDVYTAAIALLLMNFSKSGRTVDEARAWLKRIIITWAILNSLGFIMAYISPLLSGGQWNG